MDVSFFSLYCRDSTQVFTVGKAFEKAIGCNVTADFSDHIEAYQHKPLCLPISYFALPIILVEFVKTVFIIRKFYSQVKSKYLSEQKNKNITRFVKQQHQDILRIAPKKVNSLPNFGYDLLLINTIKQRRSLIQTNMSAVQIKIKIPT